MFSDESQAVVDCPSVWRIEVKTKDRETETPAITRYQRGLQTTRRREAECQTDSFMYVQEELSVDSSELDPEMLRSLRRLEPLMCRELERASRSTAFEGRGFGGRGGVGSVGGSSDTAPLRLSVACAGGSPEHDSMPVSALSWSATGAFVAAALGRSDHQDWCLHRGAVCVWNAASARGQDRQQQQQQKPHAVLETSSCVTSVQYHPSNASLLAGGSFTGELLIWNVSVGDEAEQLIVSSLGKTAAATAPDAESAAGGLEVAHREPIVEILWLKKSAGSSTRDYLLTVGADGLLLLWQLDPRKAALTLAGANRLSAKSLPKSLRVRASGRAGGVGVTCARLVSGGRSDSSMVTLAVGCEPGAVLICRVKSRASKSKPFDPSSVPRDPELVRSIDCGGLGVVLGLDSVQLPTSSPAAAASLFIVSGGSGACALYAAASGDGATASSSSSASASATSQPPLLCLETAAGAASGCSTSSAARPGLVAIATEQTGVLVYALGGTGSGMSATSPVATLSAVSGSGSGGSGASNSEVQQKQQQRQCAQCVQWNPVNQGWLAAGTADGRLLVWQEADGGAVGSAAGVSEFFASITGTGGGGSGQGEGQEGGEAGGNE